jgi:hypothetical protein
MPIPGHVDQGNTRVQLNGNVDVVARPRRKKISRRCASDPDADGIAGRGNHGNHKPVALEMGNATANGIGMGQQRHRPLSLATGQDPPPRNRPCRRAAIERINNDEEWNDDEKTDPDGSLLLMAAGGRIACRKGRHDQADQHRGQPAWIRRRQADQHLTGNVVLTRGTLILKADRMVVTRIRPATSTPRSTQARREGHLPAKARWRPQSLDRRRSGRPHRVRRQDRGRQAFPRPKSAAGRRQP